MINLVKVKDWKLALSELDDDAVVEINGKPYDYTINICSSSRKDGSEGTWYGKSEWIEIWSD